MKISLTILGSLALLFSSLTLAGAAQEQPPATPPSDATADQPPQTPQQTPPTTTPTGAPPATQPPQTPQTPAGTNPPDQTPLAPQPRTSIRQPPPPLPKIPDIRQPGETGYWIGVSGWFPIETPTIDKGHSAAFTQPSLTKLQGKPKFSQGAEVGIALGLHNALRFSYFESRAAGTFTTNKDLVLWGQGYPATNLVSTNYRLQNFKLSFDYLTWPYPVESRGDSA